LPKTETNLRDQGDLSVANDNNPSAVANDNDRPFPAYLLDRSARRREPGLVFEWNQMRAEIQALGGTGIFVPDAIRPHHINCNEIYFGVASSRAVEKPHHHHRGWEAYLVLEGEADMLVKWHEEVDWQRRLLRPHDSIFIAPGVCHWLRWQTDDGYVVVFKAPTIPGIGKPPNGKQMCTNGCHLYKNGCVLPDGYNPD
jgi:mannose-6-phosphate isomerase-like protein (cupin superfamily)